MGAVAADRAQVMAAEVEAIAGQQLLGAVVVEGGPLELEEEEHRLERGRPLLDALHEGAAVGVGGVGREPQLGIGRGPADELVDLRELTHRGGEACGVDLGERAPIGLGEGGGELVGPVERLVDTGGAGDEVVEVPYDFLEL